MGSVYLRTTGAGWMAILLGASLAGAASDLPCPVYDNHPPTAHLDASGPVAVSGDTVVVNGQVFVRSAEGWTNQAVFEGEQAFLDGNILVAGRYEYAVYARTGTVWNLETVLPRADPRDSTIAISGNTVAVGYSDETLTVMVRAGTNWLPQAGLRPSVRLSGSRFGASVAIDGDTLVAGAPGRSPEFDGQLPNACVFVRSGTTWVEQAKLTDADGARFPDSQFGLVVRVSGDTIAVGDPFWDADRGAVSIFQRFGTNWVLQQRLVGQYHGNHLGNRIDLDGDTLVVNDSTTTISIYCHRGTNWTHVGRLHGGGSTAISGNVIDVNQGSLWGANIWEPRPWHWLNQDVGAVGAPGAVSKLPYGEMVSGSGAGIEGTADAFHYAYREWTGDGQCTFYLRSFGAEDPQAKVGLMFRASVAPDSANAFLFWSDEGKVAFQGRPNSGQDTVSVDDDWPMSYILQLKLVRRGNVFTGYEPGAGKWKRTGSLTATLPATALIGLAVTSHRPGTLATAVFEDFEISSTIDVPKSPGALSASAVSASQINLSWTDHSDNEEGFAIDRSADGVNFAQIGTVTSNVTTYSSIALDAATLYHFRVRATSRAGDSPDSNTASVQTKNGRPTVRIVAIDDTASERSPSESPADWARFTVTRSGASGASLTVRLRVIGSATNSVDYRALPQSITIPAGTNALSINVEPLEDGEAEGTETVTVDILASAAYIVGSESASTVTIIDNDGLAAPWSNRDIGQVGLSGTTGFDGQAFSVRCAGADINGTNDAFHFVYQSMKGDGVLVARVTGIEYTHPFAQAGVMVRTTLDPSSTYAFMGFRAAERTLFHARTDTGEDWADGAWLDAPRWVKIVRSGNNLAGFESGDGVRWTRLSFADIDMPEEIFIGLAVTSSRQDLLCSASFDHVAFSFDVPRAPSDLRAVAGLTRTELTWTDNSTNELGFRIENNVSGPYWGSTSVPANVTNFTIDTDLYPRTTRYRVQAMGTHDSAYSGPITVTTGVVGPLPPPWTSQDIGSPSLPGNAHFRDGIFRVAGAGTGVAGQADQFHYAYQPWAGDGEIITFFQNSVMYIGGGCDPSSSAGLMFRQSLDPNAAHAHVLLTAGEGARFQVRTNAGALTTEIATSGGMTWVRLTRRNNVFTAYLSNRQDAWTEIGSVIISMTDPVYVGMAVNSRSTDCLQHSTFRQVHVASPTATLHVGGLVNDRLPVVVEGQRGLAYTLEASTNLIHWTRMQSLFNAGGTVTFSVNPYPLGAPRQFYRVVSRP